MSLRLICLTLLGIIAALGEPTEEKNWTSTADTQITAQATSLDDSIVTFQTSEGRELKVPLAKLVAADQAILKKHFLLRVQPAPASQIPPQIEQEGYELQKMLGPIEAEPGSSYYLYLPNTLAADTPAPLLFWTGFANANQSTLNRFKEAAEITGMILAASVESKNDGAKTFTTNHDHTLKCLSKIEETLPVNFKRLFFSGSSGGGATAFYNADRIKCAGAMPYVAYMPDSKKPNNGDYFYICSGARDFNRYTSALAATKFKKTALHRLYPGGHFNGLDAIATEGIIWLYTRELYDNRNGREDEIARFEARFHRYLTDDLAQSPHLAYFWTDHLLNTCKMEGNSKQAFSYLHEELALKTENQRYLEARAALTNFSKNYYSKASLGEGSLIKHTTPKIIKAAEALLEEFPDVIEMSDTFKELGKPTVEP